MNRSTLYDRLYALADSVIKKHNPCVVQAETPTIITCIGSRHGTDPGTINRCCSGCNHHSSTGCTVQALYCKVWLCPAARYMNNSLAITQLARLENIARKHDLLHYRASKEESLARRPNFGIPKFTII